MYTFELATEKDIPDLVRFFESVYYSGHTAAKSVYLSWQYRDNPANIYAPRYPNLLLKSGTRILGHVGMIPYIFSICGEKKHGAFLANLVVDESLRSRGAGALLVKEAEKYFSILYAMRVNASAQPAMRYNGWQGEFFMTRWVYEYATNKEKSYPKRRAHLVPIHVFDSAWDVAWGRLKNNFYMTIDRTSEYCRWRFANNPSVTYTVFGCMQSGREGYIALRIEEGNEFRACRIVDFAASAAGALPLLEEAISFGAARNVHFIDFFSSSRIYANELAQAGFYEYDPAKNPEPPMFILPSSRKHLTTNIFYKFADDPSFAALPKQWYMTKADGDRDRA